jgi:hypothetical protein
MAKSMRSKTKRSFRRTKRESGVFAAADAARLERLNRRLAAKVSADKDGDAPMGEEQEAEGAVAEEGGQGGEGESWEAFYQLVGLMNPERLGEGSWEMMDF